MNRLHRRLSDLEAEDAARQGRDSPLAAPWYEPHPARGPLLAGSGERITWDEYERRFGPGAPEVFRWHSEKHTALP